MADELKLTTGMESDLELVSPSANVEIDKETVDMNTLALSNATKYLATYNNPKEWILDEKEAQMAQKLTSVEPEKSSILGTGAYALGELARTTYSAPRDVAGAVSAGVALLRDTVFPNADKTALERWADNYGKIEAQRERTNEELVAQEVGHPNIYNYSTAALQLIRDIALTGGAAKIGAKVAAKSAARKVAGAGVAEDIAQRYTTMAAKRGAQRAGGAMIQGSVFGQELGSGLVNNINQYIEQTGDYDLKYYDPSVDLAVNVGVAALSAKIEKGLGVERFVPRMIVRGTGDKIPALTQVLMGGVEGFIGEGGEEGAQAVVRQIGDMISGYRDWLDFDWNDILTNMTVGGVLGGAAGSGLHYLNRRAAIRRLTDEGLDPKTAADLVDTIASREINKTLNDLSAVTELKTQNGQAYDKLKASIKSALETQGWSEKIVDATGTALNIDEYSGLVAKTLVDKAISEANKSGLPIDTFLDIASFANINNVLYLRPLGTAEDIQKRIAEQDAIIARQRELKKTGAGDDKVLQQARMKRNILQNAYVQAKVRSEVAKVELEDAKTPEIKQEITNANTDSTQLTKTETKTEFDANLDPNLTTAEKDKRFGNAVIKKIFGKDKFGFDSVMTLPEYTEARNGIINSANRIFEFAKKHRTYGIYADLRNALNKMQTVNAGNFIDSITTPSLDGVDVVVENAFLYHFIFSDAPTISAYIDAYLQRAEASITGGTQTSLSKKDLVGQVFKAIDDLMQVQAESAGIEYTSIYDSTGALVDKNVMAVLVSYQNQFVSDQPTMPLEQFDLADENARLDDIYPAYKGETIEVDGKERTVYNSEGNRIAKSAEALRNFWRWFGDSKVVDEQGRPIVMYHGTSSVFDTFDSNVGHMTDSGFFGSGFYFTPIKSEAEYYGRIVMPVYLKIEKPFIISTGGYYSGLYDNLFEGGGQLLKDLGLLAENDLKDFNKYEKLKKEFLKKAKVEKIYTYDAKHNEVQVWRASFEKNGRSYESNSYRPWEEIGYNEKEDTKENALNNAWGEYAHFNDLNFLIQDLSFTDYIRTNGLAEELSKIIKSRDYDGTIAGDEHIVFEPTQIKSVDNRGTYSEKTGNIYYQADIKNLFQPVKSQLNNFREKVRNVFQGKANKQSRITVVNETPVVYQALGFDKKPLSVSYSVISKINKDKHNIPVSVVEDLPELVSDPVAVFRSKTDPENSVVAVLDAKDTGERTVVSIIRKTDGSYNVVPSVYGKDNFESFVANNVKDGNLLYIDENKVAAIRPSSLQLLGVYNDNLSSNNYITKSDVVNQNMQMLPQGRTVNGFYDPELAVIVLGRNMNEMTLPHEMAHYWLDTIFNIYQRVQSGELKVKEGWLQSTKDLFDMVGIDQNQTQLTKGQHEKFARMTEAYLTGIGVSQTTNQTFKEYLSWVPAKYKSIAQLAYLDDNGKIQLPFLDQAAVDFFNRWYENPSLPSLESSPERERFMNVTDDKGDTIKVSIKEMNDREKEFGQDAEEQERTDQRLYNTLDENMPADVKPTADAQKVVIAERGNFLKDSEQQQRRWFERKSRDTEAQLAQDYIEKNPEHAKEVIYGDPELVPNDTGVDRATLINAYMALNNITPKDEDWARLHTNIAINQSLAGTQLALSNDKSYQTYLDALREIESALELKAATNYAGSKRGAIERFNRDIQRFLDRELPSIFATKPNTKERETALRIMFEKARTTFSGNTTGGFLMQEDLNYAKAQKGSSEAFIRWAMNQIKKDAGAKLSNEQQAKLLEISAKAQQALVDIDNPDSAKAVAAAQELRKWQQEKQKMMGVSPKKFSLMGDYAPRAMLASINTLFFANVPSTAMNTLATRVASSGDIFGKNDVSESLINKEVKRIKAIYGATSMNLAQMEKPTSPSLLHGEKYSASGQKWYDPYIILGKEDNFFRVPTFVNTLARIASTDAKATGRSADEVFKEYLQLNNQTDAAKLARKQALAVANMAVFTQDGALASCLNHIRSELNKVSRVMLGLDPQGFGLGNLLAPFLTTGANIAEMGVRGALAPVIQLTTWANQLRTGKALDPMNKLALRMDWTYFTMSAVAMVLLSALTSDDDEFYTDPYRTGIKYDPNKPYDSINIGGVWVDLDFFGAFAIPMRTAAMFMREWKKDNNIGSAVIGGYTGSAKNVIGDVPLVESIVNNQFSWAVKQPGTWAGSYTYTQLNKLVPAQIKPISRAISRGAELEYEGAWLGKSVGRKFHRNYGFDGAELTTQDLIEILTIKAQLGKDAEQYLNSVLGL